MKFQSKLVPFKNGAFESAKISIRQHTGKRLVTDKEWHFDVYSRIWAIGKTIAKYRSIVQKKMIYVEPASITRTLTRGFADSLFARTQPAVPPTKQALAPNPYTYSSIAYLLQL